MFEGIPIAVLGVQGLLTLAAVFPYLQMGRGKLVPWSLVEMEVKKGEHYREAHQVSEEARAKQAEVIAELSRQVRELVNGQETTVALVRSIAERKP